MCIPLPRRINIGCCAHEKLLSLIAHRRVRFFTFIFLSTLVCGAGGSLNLIQALESIVILETHECASSVSTWCRKSSVWSSILAWGRMKRVTCFAECNSVLDKVVLRADINNVCLGVVQMKIKEKEEEQHCKQKWQTGKEQMIKTYGKGAACRSACMHSRGAKMQLQLHKPESKPKTLTRLSPNFVQPMVPRHTLRNLEVLL